MRKAFGVMQNKKVSGLINCIFIVVCVLLSMTSCSKEEIDFKENDKLLIQKVYVNQPKSAYEIVDLSCYYYENRFYYDLTSHVMNSSVIPPDESIEVLYVFECGDLYTFFNISNLDNCYEYYSYDYEAFLEAKEKGVKNDYSKEYIDSLISEYFVETEPLTMN